MTPPPPLTVALSIVAVIVLPMLLIATEAPNESAVPPPSPPATDRAKPPANVWILELSKALTVTAPVLVVTELPLWISACTVSLIVLLAPEPAPVKARPPSPLASAPPAPMART